MQPNSLNNECTSWSLFRAERANPKNSWGAARYTTLLRAVELWGAVQADGPGRLAGDEEPPAVDGFVVGREENFSQLGFPPRSGGFCKEPEHPRRAKWHTDDLGDGLRVSIRPNRFSA